MATNDTMTDAEADEALIASSPAERSYEIGEPDLDSLIPAAKSSDEEDGIFNQFYGSLESTIFMDNPRLAGRAIEGMGRVTGIDSMREFGENIVSDYEDAPDKEQFVPKVSTYKDVDGLNSAMNYIGSSLGSGLGSIAITLTGAGVGAAGGAALGSVVPGAGTAAGAVSGGVAVGSAASGFLLNYGDTYEYLVEQQGMDPDDAAKYAIVPGAIMGGLEAYGVGKILKGVGSKDLSNAVIKRTGQLALAGASTEAVTEAGQQIVQETAGEIAEVAGLATKEIDFSQRFENTVNAFIAGGLTGGAVGGATAPLRRPTEAPPSSADGSLQADEFGLFDTPSEEIFLTDDKIDAISDVVEPGNLYFTHSVGSTHGITGSDRVRKQGGVDTIGRGISELGILFNKQDRGLPMRPFMAPLGAIADASDSSVADNLRTAVERGNFLRNAPLTFLIELPISADRSTSDALSRDGTIATILESAQTLGEPGTEAATEAAQNVMEKGGVSRNRGLNRVLPSDFIKGVFVRGELMSLDEYKRSLGMSIVDDVSASVEAAAEVALEEEQTQVASTSPSNVEMKRFLKYGMTEEQVADAKKRLDEKREARKVVDLGEKRSQVELDSLINDSVARSIEDDSIDLSADDQLEILISGGTQADIENANATIQEEYRKGKDFRDQLAKREAEPTFDTIEDFEAQRNLEQQPKKGGVRRLFHGSPVEFEEFRISPRGKFLSGVYLSDSAKAGGYAGAKGLGIGTFGEEGVGYTYEVEVDTSDFMNWMQPITDSDYEAFSKAIDELGGDGAAAVEGHKDSNFGNTLGEFFNYLRGGRGGQGSRTGDRYAKNVAQKAGYKGVQGTSGITGDRTSDQAAEEIVVFDPADIKIISVTKSGSEPTFETIEDFEAQRRKEIEDVDPDPKPPVILQQSPANVVQELTDEAQAEGIDKLRSLILDLPEDSKQALEEFENRRRSSDIRTGEPGYDAPSPMVRDYISNVEEHNKKAIIKGKEKVLIGQLSPEQYRLIKYLLDNPRALDKYAESNPNHNFFNIDLGYGTNNLVELVILAQETAKMYGITGVTIDDILSGRFAETVKEVSQDKDRFDLSQRTLGKRRAMSLKWKSERTRRRFRKDQKQLDQLGIDYKIRIEPPTRVMLVAKLIEDFHWTLRLAGKDGKPMPPIPNLDLFIQDKPSLPRKGSRYETFGAGSEKDFSRASLETDLSMTLENLFEGVDEMPKRPAMGVSKPSDVAEFVKSPAGAEPKWYEKAAERQRGAGNILRQMGETQSKLAKAWETDSGIATIREFEADVVKEFVNMVGPSRLQNIAFAIEPEIRTGMMMNEPLGLYFFGKDIVGISHSAIANGRFVDTTIHELWHGLSQYLPDDTVNDLYKQYARERGKFMRDNPEAFDRSGELVDVTMAKNQSTYRYSSFDEWCVEKMKDLSIEDASGRLLERGEATSYSETSAGKRWERALRALADLVRSHYNQLKAIFGRDVARKTYTDFMKGKYMEQVRQSPLADVIKITPEDEAKAAQRWTSYLDALDADEGVEAAAQSMSEETERFIEQMVVGPAEVVTDEEFKSLASQPPAPDEDIDSSKESRKSNADDTVKKKINDPIDSALKGEKDDKGS